ncbi:sigma factor-like helix-turn-helix DNA-binding protein [Nocardia wallacei]|uniref:sigma factor-like helix-turn-helix DNA-binding protein n=1 Tax=Nocardia wallacei TaxID=480035 RepID=UPI002455DF31|nr:sigma factor-like helix-turn-helix DNA-binding protein [Nocardia wallacei]
MAADRSAADPTDSSVTGAFATLPSDLRQVLWLMEVEGYSADEVAEQLGSTPEAVGELAVRARAELSAAYVAVRPEHGPLVAALSALAADGEGLTEALASGGEVPVHDERLDADIAMIRTARVERPDQLGEAVRRLRPGSREYFVRWFMGQPVDDIAAATGRRRSYVEAKLDQAIHTVSVSLSRAARTPLHSRWELTDDATLLLTEAIQAHEPHLLDSADAPLSAEERELFDPYFVQGRTVADIAATVGEQPRAVRRRIHRLARRLASTLTPDVLERYLSGGELRRATQLDVAREAGLSEDSVRRALSGHPDATPQLIERVTVAARRLGVGSGRPGVIADGDEATSNSPVPIVRDRRSRQERLSPGGEPLPIHNGSPLTEEATLLLVEAIWAYEPYLLDATEPPLSVAERRWFEPYFAHRRTVPDIASDTGMKPKAVRRRMHRLARRLATGLPPDVVERYLSGGTLRRATRLDVAREAGVSEATVKRILGGHLDASPETIERIRAAADRLGVDRETRRGVVADGDEATSNSPVPIVRDDDRLPYQLRGKELQLVRATPAAELRRLIPFLSQGDQQVARLLLLESVSAGTAAERLDRPTASIRQAQHHIAVLLAAMLTTENWDLLLAEAVAAHDPDVLAEAFPKLTPTQRLYAQMYLTEGRSTADIAAVRGIRQDTVNGLLRRIGRVLVRELPSILVRHYMSQGPLRRATLADVAAGSGVREVTARRVLTTGGGDPRTAQRIRAEADRLGWASRRPGVVVGHGDGTSPVPVVRAGTTDYPRHGRAFRIIHAADPDVLATCVDRLPPAYRIGGTLLYSDELTIAEKSRLLGLSPARIGTLRKVAAPRLATMLSTGLLLSDGTALHLVEAVAANQPEALSPCYSQLSQIEWEYADLYLVQGLSQAEIAEATNRSPSAVKAALYRIAHVLAAELPTGLVRQTIGLGSLRRVTLADLAEQAGVSKVSVERVLSDQGGTNAETAQRVRATAERFGWTPQRRGIVAVTANGLLPAGEFPWHTADYSEIDDMSAPEPNVPTPWSERPRTARATSATSDAATADSTGPGRTPWTGGAVGDNGAARTAEPAHPHPVPEHVRKCVVQTVRAAWAVGYDGALIPADDADGWDELEASLGSHLSPTPIAATTNENQDPLGYLLDAIADPDNDLDSAVIVVDEGAGGDRAHGYLATSVDGEVVIFDTNIASRTAGPEPPGTRVARVRTRENWRQSFPHAQQAFVLEFVTTDQGLQSRPGRRPDPADRSHRILGPPTGDGPARG